MSTEGLGGETTTTTEQTQQTTETTQQTEWSGPAWAKDWAGIKDLEPEIVNDPSLKVFNDPAALLKSYVHGRKELGKKGVLIPSETSPKEEHDQFWAKVGVPLEEAKYKESFKAPEKNVLGEEFTAGFLKVAHENRLPPKAAQKAFEYFQTQVESENTKAVQAQQEKTQQELDALAGELGPEAYAVKLKKTTDFLVENLGAETVKFLGESGLGKNAKVVKMLMGMADKFGKEGEVPQGDVTFGMTIAEMDREINAIMGNFDDPYYKPSHPDHKRRVDEVLTMNRKIDQARSVRK